MIRVLLADDQELIRSGFKMILSSEDDLEVVGEVGDGKAAVDKTEELRPDVVLMDIRMPLLDGVEATKRIIDKGTSKVLVLTTFDLDEYLFGAIRAGASGFLLKDVPPEDLVDAIRIVAGGDGLIEPRMTRRLLKEFADSPARDRPEVPKELDDLTEREREVLIQIAKGLSNSEIAGRLFISETTVKTHVGHILSKLNLRDRIQAVVLAYEAGLELGDDEGGKGDG